MLRALDVGTSILASTCTGWRGSLSFRPARRKPEKSLQLYEFEASPFCRLVREVLTELDLDVQIFPCPRGGARYRPKVMEMGGKTLFPFLVDPNTGTRMYESADIIEYLARSYEGELLRPARGVRRALAVGGGVLGLCARGLRGLNARPSKTPEQPLELFSFESSPYSRLVRETLCELELTYVLRNTGKGRWTDLGPPAARDRLFEAQQATGRNRAWLAEHTGRVQVPYLIDPNTGQAMYESAAIIAYLQRTYAL